MEHTKTINIGTYKKEDGFGIREQVKKYAKHRGQKIRVRMKGRGKGDYADGSYTKADNVAVYLDIEEDVCLKWEHKRMITEKLIDKVEVTRNMILNGFKGINNLSDTELIQTLIDLL